MHYLASCIATKATMKSQINSQNNVVPIDLPVATKRGCKLPARTVFLMEYTQFPK